MPMQRLWINFCKYSATQKKLWKPWTEAAKTYNLGGIYMDIMEAMKNRHSVRRYEDKPIESETLSLLQAEVAACNEESGLNIQLVTNEPEAFGGRMAHYGKFSGVSNYIALVGKKQPGLDEKLGYYGERIVLKAQMLGLNTCWVAMSYSRGKSRCNVQKGEKLVLVISVGFGASQGHPHKSRAVEELYSAPDSAPEWFMRGMQAALLAPTAMNQQKFKFTLCADNTVKAESTGGFYSKVDLGIAKYHFETAAGKENFRWA